MNKNNPIIYLTNKDEDILIKIDCRDISAKEIVEFFNGEKYQLKEETIKSLPSNLKTIDLDKFIQIYEKFKKSL